MTWEPTSVTTENWGRLQIIIGGTDLTLYRDIPTIVESWSSEEPFDDKTAVLRFPGITSYEDYADLPFNDFDNVDIYRVDENNNVISVLWEGFVGSTDDSLETSENGLTVECLGALYQADFFTKVPNFGFAPEDSGFSIAAEMNLRSKYYGLRLKQMNWLTYSSNPTRNQGSWNKMLTGWAQELLANAYTPSFMFDDETAWGIAASEDGYWVLGDHGTFCVFGENMPNHGSSTWFNAIFIHLFKDPGLYVTDVWYDKDRKEGYYLSRGGYVGRRLDFKSDTPGFDPWYGEPPINSDVNYIAIHGTTNMGGYRTLNIYGQVHNFGDAVHYGNGVPLGTRSFQNGTVFADIFMDMVPTPSGDGYWLLSWGGQVQAFGDATNFGNFTLDNDVFIAIETNAAGTGLYGLDTNGKIHTLGSATHYGDSSGTGSLATAWRDMTMSDDGAGYAIVRSDGRVDVFGDQPDEGEALFSTAADAGGNVSQYTMTKLDGRRPVVRTKDTWTVDWTVTVGTPGVVHTLSRDRTQMPNVFFGEGTDSNNCKWRNSKYPNFYPGESGPPTWPTYYISVGENNTSPGVTTWQQRMQQQGWPIAVDGVYDEYDANICRFMQGAAGITVDGIIGPQTWTTTFQPGSSGGDLKSAYIAPLIADPRVEPFLYNSNGSILGDNPEFTKSIMRIETYNNYGEKSSKREAMVSARNELKRNADPGFIGTITLDIDPEEGSRLEMKAGENILYKHYRGENVLFHISAVQVNMTNLSVTLTVDSKGRDAMTVAAMLDRDRSIGDPPLKPTRPKNSSAKLASDTNVVFDCESKAGFIPYFATPGNLWNVIRIPVGEVGTVVKTEFTTIFPATTFSIGIFDRHVTANQLMAIGDPETEDYWKDFPEDIGLLISWGGDGQMGGYYPGRGSDDDEVTGRLVDASSWNFWSSDPPWIWIAIWATGTCAISGRLYPGPDAGFNFASVDAVANPMETTSTDRPTPAYYGDYP